MLDVGKLATLRAVLARGSFSAAAVDLNLTQPAVSRQVSLLERQVGTQLVRRTQRGVRPTEAGRLLAEHTEAVLGRLARAEAQVADLAGLRAGHVRLGSFFTALVYLSAEVAAVLEARHPDLFRLQDDVIKDQLVDRAAAFRGLAAGDLDVAIVFDHAFAPNPPPADIEVIPLFDDPPRALLPVDHALAGATSITATDMAGDTWIRAHRGTAAELVDHVLSHTQITPPILHAGHGDEPIEAQAFIAAGRGVTVAHRLNVILDTAKIASVPLRDAPLRQIQAAIMCDQRAPTALAVIDALRDVGQRHASE
jgi:DNA-binding transcriptional LysR family regulator